MTLLDIEDLLSQAVHRVTAMMLIGQALHRAMPEQASALERVGIDAVESLQHIRDELKHMREQA